MKKPAAPRPPHTNRAGEEPCQGDGAETNAAGEGFIRVKSFEADFLVKGAELPMAKREWSACKHGGAIIPPRKTAKPRKTVTAGALAIVPGPMADNGSPRNEALRASKYLGRALWRRRSGYHRRSGVAI